MLGGFSVVLYSKKIASIKNKIMVSGQPSKVVGSKASCHNDRFKAKVEF